MGTGSRGTAPPTATGCRPRRSGSTRAGPVRPDRGTGRSTRSRGTAATPAIGSTRWGGSGPTPGACTTWWATPGTGAGTSTAPRSTARTGYCVAVAGSTSTGAAGRRYGGAATRRSRSTTSDSGWPGRVSRWGQLRQEVAEDGVEGGRLFEIGQVSRAVDDAQGGAGDGAVHGRGVGDRGELVVPADHDQRRYRHLREDRAVVAPLGPAAQRGRRTLRWRRGHHGVHVCGHGRQGRHVVWRDHPGEHLVGVPGHALREEPVGGLPAVPPAVLGVRLRCGVRQDERADPVAELPVALHDDLPAHGQAAEHDVVEPEVVEQGGEVTGERLQGSDPRYHRAAAVPAEVGGDDAPAGPGELGDLRCPHRAVERVAVHENERRALAFVVVSDGDSVDGRGTHGSEPGAGGGPGKDPIPGPWPAGMWPAGIEYLSTAMEVGGTPCLVASSCCPRPWSRRRPSRPAPRRRRRTRPRRGTGRPWPRRRGR